MRFFAGFSLLVIMLAAHDANAQNGPATSGPCSTLKLEVSNPGDVIKPPSELLVEVKLTNIGEQDVWLSGDWWSYQFDVRDAMENPVPKSAEWLRAIHERPVVVTANVSRPLAPGASETQFLMLEKLFDLTEPGEYTIRVSSSLGCTDRLLASNILQFAVAGTMNRSPAQKPPISIHAATPLPRVPVGWAVPLDIVVTNSSKQPRRWAVMYPWNSAPDEFGMGVEVFDSRGKLLPSRQHPNPDWDFSSPLHGSVELIALARGKQAEQIVAIGNLSDISKPGRYSARVVLLDPDTKARIESNPVAFVIGDQQSESRSPLPPFIVTVRSEPIRTSSGHLDSSSNHIDPSGILICMSNISDHDITLDNASSKDYTQIEGPNGKPAPKTEAALKDWRFIDPEKVIAGQGNCCNWSVKPRKALCGGIYSEPTFDLSSPGTYMIRVDRYDEPDATPGEKLNNLPILHSNWLTFVEPASR